MWQNFAVIGQGTSEIRLKHKAFRTIVPGGLKTFRVKHKPAPQAIAFGRTDYQPNVDDVQL